MTVISSPPRQTDRKKEVQTASPLEKAIGFFSGSQRQLWLLLILVMLIRLVFLGTYPLADTTEARYGEMARLMVETNDWITPQISRGVPYWGKPPLSFWITAVSFKLFGVTEFSARLPQFLIGVALLAMVGYAGSFQRDRKTGLTASVILASTLVFWVGSGAVMTDHTLAAGTTLAMIAFWKALYGTAQKRTMWGRLFFTGTAIGVLAKGPVAAVLIFLPVAGFTLLQENGVRALSRLPWRSGMGILLVLTLPWYCLAEVKTPGFLQYFLIGEHFKRFLVPGWEGDLYGSAHARPRGMIWLYWLASAFPWSLWLAGMAVNRIKNFKKVIKTSTPSRSRHLFLLLWSACPMIFFTMAGNILPAYVLPGIPPFALLAAEMMEQDKTSFFARNAKRLTWLMVLLFSLASTAVFLGVGPAQKSQKKLINRCKTEIDRGDANICYYLEIPFSAMFYSREQAFVAKNSKEVILLLENKSMDFLAVEEDKMHQIPKPTQKRFVNLGRINGYFLLKVSGDDGRCQSQVPGTAQVGLQGSGRK